MDRHGQATPLAAPGPAGSISRRSLLKGAAAASLGVAAGALAWPAGFSAHAAAPQSSQPGWQQFDATVQAAMQTFGMVGAAVAVVNAAGIVHSNTFGVRDLASGAPVTPSTLFHVASTTKSMTSLLVATFVDEGLLTWDQPVIDAWPAFRAPTDELTQTLRVRDLLGMDSGLGAPAATDLHQDYPTALELLQSVATLPVLGPPRSVFFYNNTVYSAAGYLPSLAQGVAADDLESSYARLMQDRVFGPAGMSSARIADDPRPYTDDYATGYAFDFVAGTAPEPGVPTGSFAPVGGTLAGLDDMAAYLRLQLRRGLAGSGRRVVSATNLAECWQPHIDEPISATFDPDLVSAGYAMRWNSQTYRDGRRLVWHNGGTDGFTSFVGSLPDDNLGLVVLTNSWVTPGGIAFYTYVLNLLLSGQFGLNQGVNETVVAAYRDALGQLTGLAAQATPVDATAIAPFLGSYEKGYGLSLDAAGGLRLLLGARATRVLAMPDGSYIAASGLFAGTPIQLVRTSSGTPLMTLQDFESVSWLSGPP